MLREPTPVPSAGRTPRQDALQISGSSDKRCSQDQTPVPRPGLHPDGGSIPGCDVREQYKPLGYCPPKLAARYGRIAGLAASGSAFPAVKLKCLDCMGWEYTEAKRCDTTDCPLWLLNRRIFGSRTPAGKERS